MYAYMHSLKVILYNIFNNFVHETKFHELEFPTCGIILVLKKSKHFDYTFWGLGMLTLGKMLRTR
jgi:hypothetical protein